MIVCYRLNPSGKETCLGILGRSGNITYFLRFFKGVEKAFREFVRKFLEITFQEFSGLMFFDLLGVEDIIVPIEECLARIFQFSEKVTFYFVQNIDGCDIEARLVHCLNDGLRVCELFVADDDLHARAHAAGDGHADLSGTGP